MRKSEKKLSPTFKKQIQRVLAQTFVDINDLERSDQFLKDFLTEVEYEVLAKRLAIAYWLKKGRSYQNIKENIKVSSATIASIQSQMHQEGFKMAIKNLEAEEWANQWTERIKKFIK